MKLFNFINLGGPINWVLFALLCFCLCQCIERAIYMIFSSTRFKNSIYARVEKRIAEVKNLSVKEKQKELNRTASLLYYEMNRGLWFLNFTSAVAPSLGLLGTVAGLISAFQGLASTGSQVNVQLLSGGIWIAMLTTAFGMMISIPALFFYRTFRRIIEKRSMHIELIIEDEICSSCS